MLKIHLLLAALVVQTTGYDNIQDLMKYRIKTKPPTVNNAPLDVKLGMYLESLGNFRSTEMSFDVDLYVYMSWRDVRLSHNESDYVLINDDESRKKIWLPDLYFSNARQSHFQEVTTPNFNMFVAPDGTVAYSCRCTLTVACSLDLRFYPMDNQICSIRVVSYAYIARQMNVTWFDADAIRHNPEIGLPEFQITAVNKGYCNGTYRYAMMANSHKLDDFSCLAGLLYLSRSIGYNLVQSYIPTGLIVMISWVSFWIDRRAVPARVTLSFTTLVSLTTLGNGLRFGLPQVSYAKAIDLWYGVCMLFVFLALLEFAIVNSYMRKSEKFEQMAKKFQLGIIRKRSENTDPHRVTEKVTSNGIGHGEKKAAFRYIDESNRTAAPASFTAEKHASSLRLSKFPDKNRYEELTPEGFMCSDNEERGFGEIVESTNSIYDNVSSPWKDFKLSLLADDSSKGSDDELWEELNRNKPKVVYDPNGRTSTTKESLSVTVHLQMSRVFSRNALFIDKLCRYGFPLLFFFWNVWYWWYYLVVNGQEEIESQ